MPSPPSPSSAFILAEAAKNSYTVDLLFLGTLMKSHNPSQLKKLWELILSSTPLTQLHRSEIAFLSDPQILMLSLPFGINMPEDVSEKCGKTFLQYFDYMINELCIHLRGSPNQQLPQQLSDTIIEQIQHKTMNLLMTYEMVKIIKAHQLPVDQQILARLTEMQMQTSENHYSASLAPEQMAAAMNEIIQQQGIRTGFEFCHFISDDLAILPPDAVRLMLPSFVSNDWIVDALLLLTLHQEPELGQVAAELLTQLPDKKWKQLTNRNYLTLVQRFGDDAVKAHLPEWSRLAMKYARQNAPCQVVELYASFADGNQSILFCGLIKEPETKAQHLIGSVFRVGYGLVDSYFTPHIEQAQYRQIANAFSNELQAIPCDPLLLSHVIPWALATQLNSPEKMNVEMLQLLALLPPQWTEPQPFDLNRVSQVCKIDSQDPAWKEKNRKSSKFLLNTPMTRSWIIENIAPRFTKPRQVRDHYYLSNPQPYVEALALAGLLSFYYQQPPSLVISSPQLYLASAYLLAEGNLGQKSFPLFDWLAEESLLHRDHQNKLALLDQHIASPTGYVIKVELVGSKPKIWRRFTVSSAMDLESFHQLLQDIMGWENAHLYMFHTQLGHIDNTDETDLPADDIPLMAVLQEEGDRIDYIYDYGDHWEHTISLEKINKRSCSLPKVTAGNGACPPEDCGGIWGYALLLALTKKENLSEDEQDQLMWYGMDDDWNARQFDKDQVNTLIENTMS
ncbi:plasmid pRiA4b ORF-3 family protein [Photobacterium sp. WH80]|uniref:plasmid pRiA4b ORF-3 family protein n=2 Tax=unclassified Photobacterium TaxID=2628852 RepID=UPI002ED14759